MKKGLKLFVFVFLLAKYVTIFSSDVIHSGDLIAIPQLGHSGAIFSVAVSADGKYALSGGDDHSIRLWNLETGHEIRTFLGHTGNVIDLVISSDSKRAASIAQNDLSVRLWDLDTGRSLGILKHDSPIQAIALSPDNHFLLTGGQLTLWDLKTKKVARKYESIYVNSIAYSKDGKQMLTGSDDGGVYLLDIESGSIKKTFDHKKAVSAVAFHPTKHQIVTGSYDKTVKLWDIDSDTPVKSRTYEKAVLDLSVSDDGLYIISGGKDKKLHIWNLRDDSDVTKPQLDRIHTVAFIPGKHRVLAGGRNKLLAVWDIQSQHKLLSLQKHASTEAFLTKISDSNIISVSNYKQVSYWDTSTGQIIKSHVVKKEYVIGKKNENINFITSAAAFVNIDNNEKSIIAIGDDTGTVTLFNNGVPKAFIAAHEGAISSIAFSEKGDQLVTGSHDLTARLWKIENSFNKIKYTESHFFNHKDQVVTVAFSSDGNSVLTSSIDNFIMLSDTQTGEKIKHWDQSYDDLDLISSSIIMDFSNAVPFESKAGKYIYFLASGLRRINIETKKMEVLLNDFESGEYSLALSPDGNFIVIGKKQPSNSDESLFLWDTVNKGQLVKVGEFKSPVLGVQFANQGKVILASSLGGMYYFDRGSGHQIGMLSGSLEGESIFVTDDNYFHNTQEGIEEIILRPNNGKDTYSFKQFDKKLNFSDIIKARINGDVSIGRPAPTLSTPPILQIVEEQIPINSSDQIEIHLKRLNDTPLKSIFIYVNGRPVVNKTVADIKKMDYKFKIPLFYNMNRITVVGFDHNGISSNPVYKNVNSTQIKKKDSKLYVIGIGISEYPNLSKNLQLQYAASDVDLLAQTFENIMGRNYKSVNKKILQNSGATRQGVKEALNTLKDMKKNDLAIIHLAGHGIRANDKNFYFLTSEITNSQYARLTNPDGEVKNNKESFNETSQTGRVNWSFFEKALSTTKGQVLLFLDACHSADIVKKTIVPNENLANRLFSLQSGGIMVFSASKGRQTAKEPKKLGAGLFTDSIVKALNEVITVDVNQDGYIGLMELVEFVKNDVNDRSSGSQTPWLSQKTMFGDIILKKSNLH